MLDVGIVLVPILVSCADPVPCVDPLRGSDPVFCADPLLEGSLAHLISLRDTHHNLANMLAIFHVAIGLFESLPGKNLADGGSNDPFLHELEHFMAVVF